MNNSILTLEQQRVAFAQKRFIAMPIAGTIIWALIGLIGLTMPIEWQIWSVWIGCGSIVYLGMAISKLTGEDFFNKKTPNNAFSHVFTVGLVMSMLVFAIAIPFSLQDYTSIPLTVGILTGLMWMPWSWAVQHWVGYFHTISRTVLVLTFWFSFPDNRFVTIPFIIVGIYLITLFVMEGRFKSLTTNNTIGENT
ncbi:hypothetical protein L0668_01470 [Paraglaciecola aquimarina]|uniref:DUF308 domain-containing protein n=1 Tax=Paraglaciecola algarum TaxID=3050085 RepID=A0ABS9D1L8_9ALTE|nr:hypothetical protein [Paraglaciecola sp. G1-23]MCF2946761.1 hypothetical protein [Paraglaciecola sp. G1-23]